MIELLSTADCDFHMVEAARKYWFPERSVLEFLEDFCKEYLNPLGLTIRLHEWTLFVDRLLREVGVPSGNGRVRH